MKNPDGVGASYAVLLSLEQINEGLGHVPPAEEALSALSKTFPSAAHIRIVLSPRQKVRAAVILFHDIETAKQEFRR